MRVFPLVIVLATFGCATLVHAAEPTPPAQKPATPASSEAQPAAKPAETKSSEPAADAAKASKADEKPSKADEQSAAKAPGDQKASPQRFIPSEQVRADFDVSFPIDI